MDEGLAQTDARADQRAKEMADMPDFGALANLHSSISNMGKMRKQNQMKAMAEKLGVEIQAEETELPGEELTKILIQRAKETGKTEDQINAILAE
jgi:hypothetical protein